MSKPVLLVCLLVILIVTSQFEWRQPLVELDTATSSSQKQQQISDREEAVKEKVSVSYDCLLHLLVEWFSLRYFQSPSTKGCPYFSVVSGETSKSNSKVHCFLQIIISQERHIQRLNELVRSLQLQLLQCKGENETQNATKSYHINKQFIEVERKQILEG
ncbi:hypothetical protein AtNW77_Chr3g0197711 [Arabidopsis thaliana]